jgi:MFS family permease
MVVSTLFFGGAIGAAVGGTICDTTGRKKAIFLTDAMFVLGALVLFMAQSFTQVLIGRIIVGFAVAVSGIADVAYLHEISPTQWRGAIVSVNEACISLGFLISYVAGWGISQLNENDGWRYMFGAGSFIAIIQFMGMIFMPESPVWLREHGYLSQAKVVFELISYDDSTTHDIIPNTVPEAFPGRETVEDYGLDETHGYNTTHSRYDAVESSTLGSIQIGRVDSIDTAETEFITDSSIDKFASSHRQLIIASFLSVGSQFCGHPNILNFAPEIFEEVGVPSLFTTVLLGVLKFTITCFVIWKIESFGRKFLLLLGMGIISVSLILLSIAFAFESEEDNMPRSKQIFAIIGIFGVAGGVSLF